MLTRGKVQKIARPKEARGGVLSAMIRKSLLKTRYIVLATALPA
jgi:hypothetical protein